MIGFGSLGCSHVSQFLHAINETTFTSVDSLKDRDGRLNKEKLFREDPVLVNLALHGLTWHGLKGKTGYLSDEFERLLNIARRCNSLCTERMSPTHYARLC